MKRKEILALAKKIGQCEMALQKATDLKEKARLEQEIVKLSSGIKNYEDMVAIDEAVQDYIEKNS